MDINAQTLQPYLSDALDNPVNITGLQELAVSTRTAPWLVLADVAGREHRFVFRVDKDITAREINAMRAARACSALPVPKVYGWESHTRFFDIPAFFYDYIDGESLLNPLLAGEDWAVDAYLDTVRQLNAISAECLRAHGFEEQAPYTTEDVLTELKEFYAGHDHTIAREVLSRLHSDQPSFPAPRFSNGDLWLDNILVKDKQVVGIIDFESAGFSDPFFEFLLPFFNEPKLRGRGIEERYCRILGIAPSILNWYHGLEYVDTLRYVIRDRKPFNQYSESVLTEHLTQWLGTMSV